MLYYLGELTEKIAAEDRIQVLKAAQAKLKVTKSCDVLLRIFCCCLSFFLLPFVNGLVKLLMLCKS